MRAPPGRPSASAGRPSRSTIVGAIELVMRLPGATDSAWPGCGSKSAIVLFSSMPVPGTIAVEPNRLLIVCVAATTLPSPSATVTCVVCGEPPARRRRPARRPCAMSMSARRAAAYSLAIRRATGTSTKAGSPVAAVRSAKAIFSASASRWMPSTVPKPSAGHVEALQHVEDLDQVDAAAGRRRAAGDLEAAIASRAPACARPCGSRRGRRA